MQSLTRLHHLRRKPLRGARLACVIAAGGLVAACSSVHGDGGVTLVSRSASIAASAQAIQSRDVALGLYELTLLGDKLYVASAGRERLNETPGAIHVLDALTLEPQTVFPVPLQPYSLRADADLQTLYTGHTVDGGISRIDAITGEVQNTFRLSPPSRRGQYLTTRKLVVDKAGQRLFVVHPGQYGKVWVVDARTDALLHTIELDRMMAFGMAYDDVADRLYVSHAKGIAIVNPTQATVLAHWELPQDQNILLNLALDRQGQRLFVTDTKNGQLQVWDLRTGQVLKRIGIGPGALDVAWHAGQQMVLVTHRGVTRDQPVLESGALTLIDGATLAIQQSIPLNGVPNSLIVDDAGDAVFVTVKAPLNPQHPDFRADLVEQVVRVDLPFNRQ